MKFDYTKGKKAQYMVSIYSWNFSDHYYFSDADTAKKFFKKAGKEKEEGVSVSLWDMQKDIRKEFVKA